MEKSTEQFILGILIGILGGIGGSIFTTELYNKEQTIYSVIIFYIGIICLVVFPIAIILYIKLYKFGFKLTIFNQKYPLRFLILMGAMMFLVIGAYFLGSLEQRNLSDSNYLNSLDTYFQIQYDKYIKIEGEKTILKIVEQIKDYDNKTKLNIIGNSLIHNFSNPYWTNRQNIDFYTNEVNVDLSFNHKYFGQFRYGYGYDKWGNIRAQGNTKFVKNPIWIAYMKTGACEELAILFNETANRANISTRIVHSPEIGHVWNEVNIDGEWLYADLDCLYQKGNEKWLGKTITYSSNCWNDPFKFKNAYIFPNVDEILSENYYNMTFNGIILRSIYQNSSFLKNSILYKN